MEEALQHCRNNMGDNATTLDDYNEYSFQDSIKKIAAGAHWDCYSAFEFYGWEAERVVAVTSGSNMMELITRAKTHIAVILVDGDDSAVSAQSKLYSKTVEFNYDDDEGYAEAKKYFLQAAELGLGEWCNRGLDHQDYGGTGEGI